METILIVDEDVALTARIEQALDDERYQLLSAQDPVAAEVLLQTEAVDVLLVDRGLDGAAPLLELATTHAPPISSIVMLSGATARDTADALDAGAAAVLDKPFTDDDLRKTLARAGAAGFRGHLQGITLVDMLQVFHIARRSLVVWVGGPTPTRIWFERGEIVHAARGELEGEAAITDVLDARAGTLDTRPFEECPRTVERSFQSLLIDLLRARDESERAPAAEPDDEEMELTDRDFSDDIEVPEDIAAAAVLPRMDEDDTNPSIVEPPDAPTAPPAPALEPAAAPTALPSRPLDPMCAAVNAEMPDALATAIVDLEFGHLLGMYNRATFSPDFERFIALYTRSLFRGPEVRHIETSLRAQRGVGGTHEHYLEEVVLTSRHTHHLTKTLKDGAVAVMVVTPRRVGIAETWEALRGLVRGIESNLP